MQQRLLVLTVAMLACHTIQASVLIRDVRVIDLVTDEVRAGMPARAALEAATDGPARLLGGDAKFGTIAAGQVADLVLLDANPLDDITNTRRIGGAMVRGRWRARADLDRLLEGVAERAAKR